MTSYSTNYAYKTLSDELRILRKAILEGNWDNHQEALKDRLKKCKQLDEVLKLMDNKNGSTYRNNMYVDFVLNDQNKKGLNKEDICKKLGL